MADGTAAVGVEGEGVAFSPALGQAICERIAAGQSIMAVCRAAGMPHRTSVKRWADRDPAFRAALGEAMLTRRTTQRMADHARAAERSGRRPPRGGSASRYTEAMGEAICWRLANGESLVAICGDPDMPCAGTVFGWLKRHPEFQDAYVQARLMQADYLFDEAREVALGATPKSVWADRLRFDTIRWMTARMAPKKYCERLVVEAAVAAVRAEARGDGGMTVVIRRFTDAPDPEAGEYPEID